MGTRADLLVAAIDFGTTYSGYAYSFRQDFLTDPLKIYANVKWNTEDEEGGTSACATLKTPTTVLFDKNETLHSFGYEAEAKYAELAEEDDIEGWKYFKRFKMILYRELGVGKTTSITSRRAKKISRDLQLTDDAGNKMLACKVFSGAIEYLKRHMLNTLDETTFHIGESDIQWVLTVPAIWGDQAKQFMREAAEEAGIAGDKLHLALEPEAAAIYCKELSVQRNEDVDSEAMEAFQPGHSFMIVDCGGGTVDITINQVQEDGSLKELGLPSGGPWGGTFVDLCFEKFLSDITGEEAWSSFVKDHPLGLLELRRAFEVKKRNVGKENDTKVTITSGISDIMDQFKEITQRDLEKSIPAKYSTNVKIFKKRLRLDHDVVEGFFSSALSSITNHVRTLFKNPALEHVSTILMVGGFSESPLLKKKMKESFPHKKFIIPRDASLSVLKGAVIFGHSPKAIKTRLSPATYGVAIDVPFDQAVHPMSHRWPKDGRFYCTDVFKVMVKKNEPLTVGETVFVEKFRPSHAEDVRAEIEVYVTHSEYPFYTNEDGCKKLGVVKFAIPDAFLGKDRILKVSMHFGYTELFVTVVEEGTDNKTQAKFDCL